MLGADAASLHLQRSPFQGAASSLTFGNLGFRALRYNEHSFTGGNMTNLNAVLQQLREERSRTQSQLEALDQAISVLAGTSGSGTVNSSGRRTMSPDARRRIAAAQRRRWAKVRRT